MRKTKVLLDEKDMPKQWYNIQADLKSPLPPVLNPQTKKPITPDDLAPIFPMGLIMQEVSQERWIDIPEEIQEIYAMFRPSPLIRAYRLEKMLDTPAEIYYKYEGVSPAGSHKTNTSIAQAYYNKKEGVKRLATETGAGQWGSALSLACRFFGLDCTVYMVKISYQQKPYRRSMINTWGAQVYASPTDRTNAGKKILAENPDSPGSLGIAISEAIEDAVSHDNTKYSLGSVLNHVLLHQTVIGLETKKQLEMIDRYPDIIIGCVGGGSNFAGIAFPFLMDKLNGKKKDLVTLAVEPTACPTLTKGIYAYDFGDSIGMAPIVKMYTLGHTFVPPGIHAGGLRYHGASPLLCALVKDKFIDAKAYPQMPVFEAAVKFAQTEGIIPAPETAHAIKAVIDEAVECKKAGRKKTILFNLSGHGNFDMAAYDAYFSGKLQDYEYPKENIDEALKVLPKVEL